MASITNYIKTGFGLSVGFQLAGILFTGLGFLFFIPGYIMFKTENEAGHKGSSKEIFAIVLMALGVILMGGFGFGMLLSSINDST